MQEVNVYFYKLCKIGMTTMLNGEVIFRDIFPNLCEEPVDCPSDSTTKLASEPKCCVFFYKQSCDYITKGRSWVIYGERAVNLVTTTTATLTIYALTSHFFALPFK